MSTVSELMSLTAQALQQKLGRYSPNETLAGSSYGLNYFQQLRTEWSLIPNAEQNTGTYGQERLQELHHKTAVDLTWSDLYAFERLVTRAVPLEGLRRVALWIRGPYKDVVGAGGYQAYENGKFPP